jgi:hypothetical protein
LLFVEENYTFFCLQIEGQFTQNPARSLFAMTNKGLIKKWLDALRVPKRYVFRIMALHSESRCVLRGVGYDI